MNYVFIEKCIEKVDELHSLISEGGGRQLFSKIEELREAIYNTKEEY